MTVAQQTLPGIRRSLGDRMFDEWIESGKDKSIPAFVSELRSRRDFLTDEEKAALVQDALCDKFRKRLKRENPKTRLPYALETPDCDEQGRSIWKQPEDMTYEESEWNLLQNLTRVKQDLAQARKWYDAIQARWPGQLSIKFPILVQVFDSNDGSGNMLELSRLNF